MIISITNENNPFDIFKQNYIIEPGNFYTYRVVANQVFDNSKKLDPLINNNYILCCWKWPSFSEHCGNLTSDCNHSPIQRPWSKSSRLCVATWKWKSKFDNPVLKEWVRIRMHNQICSTQMQMSSVEHSSVAKWWWGHAILQFGRLRLFHQRDGNVSSVRVQLSFR